MPGGGGWILRHSLAGQIGVRNPFLVQLTLGLYELNSLLMRRLARSAGFSMFVDVRRVVVSRGHTPFAERGVATRD